MNRAYGIALTCGAVPLLAGISIFALWLVTRTGGIAILLVGSVSLARFFWLGSRMPGFPRRRLWLSTVGGASLLLSNFPVAGGISAAVIAIETRYTVVVHNASRQALDSVSVVGGGCDEFLGSIRPGGDARQSFWIQHDGELEFRATSGTTVYRETIEGYVTNSMGGHTTVTVNSDGTISVRNDAS